MHNSLNVSADIQAALGDETVDRLRATLVPVDCLTCGEEITGGDGLNLAIDDVNAGLFATLHHQECRPSAWVHHSPAQARDLKLNLTWRACVLDRQSDGVPLLLVNPSCEAAVLFRMNTIRRSWRIGTLDRCAQAGFVPMARQNSSSWKVEGLKALLDTDRLTVTGAGGPLDGTTWHAEISEAAFSRAHVEGHVLVGVTTALDPKSEPVTGERFSELVRNQEILFANAPIERPSPEIDVERLVTLMELVRRGVGSVPTENQLAEILSLYQRGAVLSKAARPTGHDLTVIVLMVAGLYVASEGPVHVMTRDTHLARQLLDAGRKVFGQGFPVSRVGEPSFTSERRVSVGTFEEIATARKHFDNDPRLSAQILPLAFAVDPLPDGQRDVVRRRYSRLIEI
ncbi:hypothetical protein [Streptomyces sp. NPDC001930]|uniref:hypothetical protein n=1 Tax=Streptomyces sp. NPDC001930 TaxID=3364625 RepID=UPI00367DF40E